jgi:hypothetical protein
MVAESHSATQVLLIPFLPQFILSKIAELPRVTSSISFQIQLSFPISFSSREKPSSFTLTV